MLSYTILFDNIILISILMYDKKIFMMIRFAIYYLTSHTIIICIAIDT